MIDQRTGLEIIEETECWDLLAERRVGRVAVSISNKPDIFPVNYLLDKRAIYIHTVPGTKLAGAVLGRAVAFEIDELDEATHQGWSVVVHGVAEEVEKLEDILYAETLGIQPWTDTPKFRFLRIIVDEITGRRIPVD
ncbi:MAG: pyridoxamine 5'-phosphate oxidase family protein [Acidimicrobiia bacterium]|nr:pyridoxamine 5'-phosphate oxidase family protein [Acidimicrobiia bacterium]